jgi:hypothetical protein
MPNDEDKAATSSMQDVGGKTATSSTRRGKGKAAKPSTQDTQWARMAEKLKTEPGREIYKKRKSIVEPAFGWVKQVLRIRSFSLRGLNKVAAEWSLVCLALNLRRMAPRMAAGR